MFNLRNKLRLGKGVLLHSNPLYVQFYLTARCNLTCQQCNIIYANSDVRECTLGEIEKIAGNLSEIGVAIVLLTGGEPFIRKDLPEIVDAFERNGIHVRLQTNGLADRDALGRCVANGAHDISISLDSLKPELQDEINGVYPGSWERAVETIAAVTEMLPGRGSFAAFGCVLSPHNIEDVKDVVRFGSRIGWFTSLVPVHLAKVHSPMNFRTYDPKMKFRPEQYARVDSLIEWLKEARGKGFLVYDSDEYLEDVRRFVREEPIQWRRRNQNICDSPRLYFAVLPNGDFSVCCDHRLPGQPVSTYSENFADIFASAEFQNRATRVAGACAGCMYGSYPEVTITARYWKAAWERLQLFLVNPPPKQWPYSAGRLHEIAAEIRSMA